MYKLKLKDLCKLCKNYDEDKAHCRVGNFEWYLKNFNKVVKCEDFKPIKNKEEV